jgi:tetratricopeptide (TPR) repeat protein
MQSDATSDLLAERGSLKNARPVIGLQMLRLEAVLTELIHRTPADDDSGRNLRDLIEERGRVRGILGSRGAVDWMMASAGDYVDISKTAAAVSKLGPCQYAITHACHIYESLNRYDLAADLWRRFVQNFPRERQGWQSLAFVLKRLRNWEEELQARNWLVQQNPRSGMALIERSNVLRELGRFHESMADVESAHPLLTERERNRADVLVNIGSSYFTVGRYYDAQQCFSRILTREGVPHRLALFQRSAVLQMCGRLDAALNGYRQILMRLREGGDVPADSAWNCALISRKLCRGGTEEGLRTAIQYGRMARALYTNRTNIEQCTAKIQMFIQELKDSKVTDVIIPDRATRFDPLPRDPALAAQIEQEWEHLNRMHSECYSERVRERVFPQVLDIATHLIEVDPRGRPLYYLLQAEVLHLQKREVERRNALRTVLRLFPESAFTSPVINECHAGIRFCLAQCEKADGKPDEAVRIYTEIIMSVETTGAAGPTPFRILNELLRERALQLRAMILRREACLTDRSRLIELNPINPDYWRERAGTYRFMNLYDKERADLKQAEALEQAGSLPEGTTATTISPASSAASTAAFSAAAAASPLSSKGSREFKRDPSPTRRNANHRHRSRSPPPRQLSPARNSSPPQPSSSSVPAAPSKPRSDWKVDEVANWFCQLGGAYSVYSKNVRDNCVCGMVLQTIADQTSDESAYGLLSDFQITNSIHRFVILKHLRENLRVQRG